LRVLAPVAKHLQYVGAPTILTIVIDNHWGILVLFAFLAEIRRFVEESTEEKEDSPQRARRAQRRTWRRKICRERRDERVGENSEMERLIMLEEREGRDPSARPPRRALSGWASLIGCPVESSKKHPPPPCFCVCTGIIGLTGGFFGCTGMIGLSGFCEVGEGVRRSEMAQEQRPLSMTEVA